MIKEVPQQNELQPFSPDQQGSKVYTEEYINSMYDAYMNAYNEENRDTSLSVEEKQNALFQLYKDGKTEEAITAYEFLLAKKWDEWTEEEKQLVKSKLSEKELEEFKHVF